MYVFTQPLRHRQDVIQDQLLREIQLQAVTMSVLSEKKLDENYTRMLHAVLN